jgi:hypothetical protein
MEETVRLIKWLALAVVLLALIVVIATFSRGGPPLKVKIIRRPFSPMIQIQNIGDGVITIKNVSVNNRPDCIVTFPVIAPPQLTLKTGDTAFGTTDCAVVNITIDTDHGSATYYPND